MAFSFGKEEGRSLSVNDNNNKPCPSPVNYEIDEDESFQDAFEDIQPASNMNLAQGIEETQIALNLFLNNRFELAKAKMEPWARNSMYHALGYATIHYIKAMMTCEAQDIETAVQETKNACVVCNKFRKQNSLSEAVSAQMGKLVKMGSKTVMTDEEMHAELCYAECLLQRALLSFIQDENLVSFVRGALKVRYCYQSYRESQRIMLETNWDERDQKLKNHYESGVRMGIGTFNLMIASLPSRILRLLEFIGFTGNKEVGLDHLVTGAGMRDSLRSNLCSLVLLAWHLIAAYLFGTGGDIDLCRSLLDPMLRNYPNGALVLYFTGRLHVVTAGIPRGVEYLSRSIDAQSEWRQFHHLCFWELMFAHAYLRQWSPAADYANRLYTENKWSRATYGYFAAVFLLAQHPANLTWDERARMDKLFAHVPKLKQRIAGKSIPIEKFCVVKAENYLKIKRLTLAHYEILYLWNGWQIMGQDESMVKGAMEEISKTLAHHEKLQEDKPDDRCLCMLLKAMCLSHLQSPFQAEQLLNSVISHDKSLNENSYLIPNALFELALLKLDAGKKIEAKKLLIKAKEYKGYLMESRLHFRIHNLGDKLDFTPETPI